MKNVIFCVLILFWWSLKQIEKLKSKHFENSEVMNEWMMHLYSALLYIVVHQKRFTIMWGGGGLYSTTTNVQHPLGWCNGCHRTAAPVRYRWRGERVIEPIKWMRSPHTSYRCRGERVIDPIKWMLSPHTSYRWREKESHRANQVYALTTHKLQVERRESHRANQVYALTTHQLQVERRESHRANHHLGAHTAPKWWQPKIHWH